MNPPFPDPTSPLFGTTPPGPTNAPMTDVIVPPSTNTEKPWRYLIGYAHEYGFDSMVIERGTPLDTEVKVREFIADVVRDRRQGNVTILGMTLLACQQPLVFRVPVIDGPSASTYPYRYLLTYYGRTPSGIGFGFGTFLSDFDVLIKGPAHIDMLKDVCADASRYDRRQTHIINFVLLAGPAL